MEITAAAAQATTYTTGKTLAEQINDYLAVSKTSIATLASEIPGYSRPTISRYLSGKYEGDISTIEKLLADWLAQRTGEAVALPEPGRKTGRKPVFYESRDALKVLGVCQSCQEYIGLGIVVARSGYGKTYSLRQYAKLPRVAYIECDDTMSSRDLVEAIEKSLGIPSGYGTISGQDEDLGQQTGSFAEKYTVTDVEGDNVVVTEFIDDKQIRSYQATLGQEETIELSRENWLTLTNGTHQLRVEAVDGNFATSVRVWNFSKKETVIAFQFAKPEETDARATKILITPTWHIEGSVAKVEACNNAFDDSPAWEDITAQVAINRVYNFLNESKTAEKWGVNVRFTITKNEGYEEEVSISGFGGAYE